MGSFVGNFQKLHPSFSDQSAPKERRRRRAEKRLSKRVFLESPFLPLYVHENARAHGRFDDPKGPSRTKNTTG